MSESIKSSLNSKKTSYNNRFGNGLDVKNEIRNIKTNNIGTKDTDHSYRHSNKNLYIKNKREKLLKSHA